MKKILGALLLISCTAFTMSKKEASDSGSSSEDDAGELFINRERIAELREQGFDAFIDTKKQQHSTLSTITSLPFGLGQMASTLLEGLGIVEDTEHAKCFLGRIFENEETFRVTAARLERDEDNIAYLKAVFEEISSKRVTKDKLVQAMRKAKHKQVPEPKKMTEKNDANQYVIPDSHFCQWAACNLLVFHWHEKEQQRPPRTRRRGSGAQKRS